MSGTFEHNNKTNKFYSLSEITASVKNVIAGTYKSAYWVKAEIVKLNCYPYSGHCYPDLVEKRDNKIIAQMRATVWAGNFQTISSKFIQETGEELDEGMTVLFLAKITFHEHYGLSLNIIDIEPSFTLGEMAKGKKEALEKLKKEGVFDKNKQLPFPLLPKKVAVISVETSKGYHDFLKIIEKNKNGYRIEHFLFSALLQGDKAVESIISQLKNIASKAELFDVVLILRGGGGNVGLNAYDNYKLAKTVAEFPLPVITGIGHSTNETVTEMVAAFNKITPTEVATFLLEKFESFDTMLQDKIRRLINSIEKILQYQKFYLENTAETINTIVARNVDNQKSLLALSSQKLKSNSLAYINKKKSTLGEISTQLTFKPSKIVYAEKSNIERLTERFEILIKQFIKNNNIAVEHIETKLNLLKPEAVLKRGYSITTVNGKIIKSVKKLNKNDEIITTVVDGKFLSRIEKIKKK